MLDKLSRTDRLRLMKFICSFAWADLEVHEKERSFVKRMVKKLQLDEDDAAQVRGWLEVPPPPEDVDPTKIPLRHRELFLDAIRATIMADGVVAPEEQEAFSLMEQLI